MKKLHGTLLIITLICVFMGMGCGDNEIIPAIDFQTDASSVAEKETLTVLFSRTLPNGVTPTVLLGGSANEGSDYSKSISSTGIVFTILSDEIYDQDETIIITLTGFNGKASVGLNAIHTVTITNPGLLISLSWDVGNGTAGDVDMDLFLWVENPPRSGSIVTAAESISTGTDFEFVFLPSDDVANFPNGVYWLGYNYYEGSSDNLTVKADFKSFKGTINAAGNTASYNALYKLVNRNRWDNTGEFYSVQNFQKSGANFINFKPIEVPVSGSRVKTHQFNSGLDETKNK